MSKDAFPLPRVYGLLEPGPVVLLTTAREGRANIMTLSWHMMLEFEPPLIGCVINSGNFTFDILKATRKCVINIPTVELSQKVVDCGNCSGRTVDKFKAFGLTPVAASHVDAPLIDECYANLECKVVDEEMVEKYSLFVLKVVNAWIDPHKENPQTIHHLGEGAFMVAGEKIHLPSKMK